MATAGWQTHWHKHPGVRSGDQLTRGERAADRMRSVMGSWPFVFGFFAVMILWAVANSVLIAAKRADAIASEIALHTERNTDDIKGLLVENTDLTKAVKKNTDLLEEIHRHLSALTPEAGGFAPDEEPPKST